MHSANDNVCHLNCCCLQPNELICKTLKIWHHYLISLFFIISIYIGYGRREVVELLLASGASIQACDEGGLHPLHNACSFGHADVVRLLLEAGASPNTTDNWNFTPLHEAAQKGKIDVCIGM